jgi:SAM-dependent methyltransferase
MKILAVDGVPCPGIEPEEKPISTAKKVQILKAADEDFEFYPTTPEIMEAMKKDIWNYLRSHDRDYSQRREDKLYINTDYEYTGNKKKKTENLVIGSFLDIGAGDGRVLDFFEADNKYGIEIARVQADDLIRRGIFIVGRNFYDVTLHDNYYSLIYSNPPFSQLEHWVNKILVESNFCIMYLVMPIRWKNQKEITRELEKYEATIVGEFDFSKADREARGKVNLVRVNAKWLSIDEDGKESSHGKHQESFENAFERFVREHIGNFEEKPDFGHWEEERVEALALNQTPIDQLISDYEHEKETLGAAFKAIGKLDPAIIKLMGQDKASMLEIIKISIEGLKSKYWRATFDKLDPVQKRMTQKTRERIFGDIQEFKTLDFNADNIYSIVIWIINNCNIGILDQIGEVFDELTSKDFIEEYKSNKHWKKSDWRHTAREWKYEKLPPRWKLGLDYRIVVGTYAYSSWDRENRRTIVNDFIIICQNLGFPIDPYCKPDYKLHSTEQHFYTLDGELAFTMRYYTGNQNAHLKINKKLLMKFNIEVAKIRKWMSEPDDVVEEYGIPKDEAAKLWNSGLALLGSNDVKMLEFKEAV